MSSELGKVVTAHCITDLRPTDNYVVVTEHAVCTASVPWSARNEVAKLLDAGNPVRQVLGAKVRVIPLADIQAVQFNNKELKIALGYRDGARQAEYTLEFVGIGYEETCAALRAQLGADDWHEEQTPSTVWSAISTVLLFMGLPLVFLILGALAAYQEETGFGRPSAKGTGKGLGMWLPSWGWLVLAGVVLILAVGWAIVAVATRPPAVVVLTRSASASR